MTRTDGSVSNAAGRAVHTGWLKGARLAWAVVTLLVLALELTGIAALYDLQTARFGQSLSDAGISPSAMAALVVLVNLAVVLAHLSVASLIYLRRPRDPVALLVAWTLVTNGALLPLVFTFESVAAAPAVQLALNLVVFLGLVTSVATLYLFPDGRFVPRWTPVLLAVWALGGFLAIFFPTLPVSPASWPLALQLAILAVWVGTGLYAQLFRFSHAAGPVEQQQIKWAGLGLLAAAVTPLVYFLPSVILTAVDVSGLPNLLVNRIGPALFAVPALAGVLLVLALRLLSLLFPVSFGVAILRYRLWDIDLVINRTLVYGSLTAVVIALYVLIVGGLALVLQTQTSLAAAVAAAVVVALLALPMRQRLQRSVNRLMYGERDDPRAVLSKLAMTLETASAPADVLPNLARSVAESLRLPYVAISVRDGEESRVVAQHPPSPPAPLPLRERGATTGLPSPSGTGGEGETLSLVYQGAVVGELHVAPRAPGEAFSTADLRLLADLARQAGPAVHAVQLTTDLQLARQRLVTTREEERRRLRRDLHDGLGPQLASLSLKADTARNLVANDPAAVDRLLVEFKGQTQDAIGDIRRLVHGLRPPALDQLGLAGALREQANSLSGDRGVQITLSAPKMMAALPAAVEVAAYRIVTEALTNVVRHAGATRCTVWLCLDDAALHLAVDDNGAGLPADYRAGVGLSSMRERAEELGGACRIEARAEGGTRVAAVLPLPPGFTKSMELP